MGLLLSHIRAWIRSYNLHTFDGWKCFCSGIVQRSLKKLKFALIVTEIHRTVVMGDND